MRTNDLIASIVALSAAPKIICINIRRNIILPKKKKNENQNKCCICSFIFLSEAALKKHTEDTHNQGFHIQRIDSITKSLPTKKFKEHHLTNLIKDKDKDIKELRNTVQQLQTSYKNVFI